jgi:hypothetical protein
MSKPYSRKLFGLFFLDLRIFVKKNPIFDICPNCNSFASLERLLQKGRTYRIPHFFGFKKYHCRGCKWDGYIYLYTPNHDLTSIMTNYLKVLICLAILFLFLLYFFGDIYNLIFTLVCENRFII